MEISAPRIFIFSYTTQSSIGTWSPTAKKSGLTEEEEEESRLFGEGTFGCLAGAMMYLGCAFIDIVGGEMGMIGLLLQMQGGGHGYEWKRVGKRIIVG